MCIRDSRYLVERVCDRVVALFGDGKLSDLVGGIEEYLRRRSSLLSAGEGSGGRQAGDAVAAKASPSGASPSGESPPRPRLSGAQDRAARKDLAKLERQLDKLGKKEQDLHVKLAEAATEPDRLQGLNAELRALSQEKDDVEARWLELADQLD